MPGDVQVSAAMTARNPHLYHTRSKRLNSGEYASLRRTTHSGKYVENRPARDGSPLSSQNGLVGRYLPSSVITARLPPSGSSITWKSSLKLIALMMPSPSFSCTSAFSVEP